MKKLGKDFETAGKLMVFLSYYDLKVQVLKKKDGELYTEKINDRDVLLFVLEEDSIPNGLASNTMPFSEMHGLALNSKINYYRYLYDGTNKCEWFWHTDNYKAFTKTALDEFIASKSINSEYKEQYDFLFK